MIGNLIVKKWKVSSCLKDKDSEQKGSSVVYGKSTSKILHVKI